MLLHTEIFGDGEPIVFLHTGLQTGLTDFEYQRDHFKSNYKVILPDLRGHGQSIHDNVSNFLEDSAVDLEETLNHLNVKTAHIVGCSLGALVGLCFAKKYPSKVNSLTLSGVLPEKPDNWYDMHKEDTAFQTQLLQNEDFVSYFDKLHKSDWRKFIYMGQNEDWYPFHITKDLNGINLPILYMVGEGNKSETKGAIKYPLLKEDVHVSIIPFASHLVHSEQPEIYTIILDGFLKKYNSLKEHER